MDKFHDAAKAIAKICNLFGDEERKFIEKASQKMQKNFCGYEANLGAIFAGRVENTQQYSSSIEVRDIHFQSNCKHDFSPIIGKITVSYIPNQWVIGLSRITDCINVFTKRLQLQESMTLEIAKAMFENLEAKSVKVEILARHYCMQKTPNEIPPEVYTVHEIVEQNV